MVIFDKKVHKFKTLQESLKTFKNSKVIKTERASNEI